MPLRFRRIERKGAIPRKYQIVHLSRCGCCVFWEPGKYLVVGPCRRHPHPTMHAWEKCACWTNRHGWQSPLDEFADKVARGDYG